MDLKSNYHTNRYIYIIYIYIYILSVTNPDFIGLLNLLFIRLLSVKKKWWICFLRAKSARVITFEQFNHALIELAPKRFKGKSKEEALQQIYSLLVGKEPANMGVTVSISLVLKTMRTHIYTYNEQKYQCNTCIWSPSFFLYFKNVLVRTFFAKIIPPPHRYGVKIQLRQYDYCTDGPQ